VIVGCVVDEAPLSHVSVASASGGQPEFAVLVAADEHPVDASVGCTSSCDDNNACTADICDAGQCVHQWAEGCMPCQPGDECGGIVQTCRAGDPIWHYDGWMGKCLSNNTCPEFHKDVACDDGDPCTTDGCGYDDGDDVCLSTPITGCTAP